MQMQNYNYTNPMWNTPYSSNQYMNNYTNRNNYIASQPVTQQQQGYQNNIIWVKGK